MRQARPVAVEVFAEQLVQAADGALAPGLVEQVVRQAAQLPVITEESLQRPGQASVAVGEVLAEGGGEGLGGVLLRGLHPFVEALELGLHDIGAHADAGVAQGQQTDPQRSLRQLRSLVLGGLADECRERAIGKRQVLDLDGCRR